MWSLTSYRSFSNPNFILAELLGVVLVIPSKDDNPVDVDREREVDLEPVVGAPAGYGVPYEVDVVWVVQDNLPVKGIDGVLGVSVLAVGCYYGLSFGCKRKWGLHNA